ncbi:MAG: glycosyltransferase family 4 protein [Gemmatimonadota bacterium]|nr:MAG: glycosyltransferase family 4 protein [Gemmatimonadota bacterium]
MRIVFVNSVRGWGGGLTSAVEVGSGLAEMGHEVTLVCHPSSVVARQLASESSVKIAPIAIRAELNPYRVLQLIRLYRRVAPDVVLADRRKDVKLSVAARRLSGAFPIIHRHGAPSPLRNSAIYRHVWGREVQALVVNSKTMRQRMLAEAPWLERAPLHIIHNGKDTSRYKPLPRLRERIRRELGIPEDAFIVSFHGMVQPRKNVELLVKAVASLPADLKIHALVVGAGPTLPQLRALVAEIRAPVIFAGIREDIPEVLSAADAAAHLSTAEGLSNSVIESMACGLPLVVSDATSHAEQVEDGKQGILVPPDDWRAVADAIRWLATDPAGRERMGAAARKRATEEFSRKRMLDRYDEVLRETVAEYRATQGA